MAELRGGGSRFVSFHARRNCRRRAFGAARRDLQRAGRSDFDRCPGRGVEPNPAGSAGGRHRLQEVAPWFADRLLRESWTKDYHRAQQDGRTIIAHEFLILSRFPIREHHTEPLPGRQRRVLHTVTFDIEGAPMAVATCHLESLLEDGPVRAQQLDQYFARLAAANEAMFLGDFNFGDGEQPESARLSPDFRDAWLLTNPGQPGFTWDIQRSRWARRESFPGEPSRRLDRILVKSTRWQPVSAVLLGDTPLPGTGERLVPSDHFGLLAVFARVPDAK